MTDTILNRVVWTRQHKHSGFIPCVWYKTRQEARDSIKNFWDRLGYRVIKVKMVRVK